MNLLDASLIVVAGKGGVGRTSTSLVLAMSAAARGQRVLVLELYGMSSAPRALGHTGRSYLPRTLAPGVASMSLSSHECLDEYGRRKLKIGALVRLVFGNRVMGAFMDAVPGMHDLLQLGKVEDLVTAGEHDLVIVDAPATGHGLTFLAATRSMMEMTRVGPFYELAATIDRVLSDADRTAVVVVALPEELPVNETLELLAGLGPHRGQVGGLVVNQVRADPLGGALPWDAARPAFSGATDPDLHALGRLGDELALRRQIQDRAISRLRDGSDRVLERSVPLVVLPCLSSRHLRPEDFPVLAAALGRQLEAP